MAVLKISFQNSWKFKSWLLKLIGSWIQHTTVPSLVALTFEKKTVKINRKTHHYTMNETYTINM